MSYLPSSIPALWRAHAQNPQAWDQYDQQFSYYMAPTYFGAHGLDAYRQFYRKYLWCCQTNGLWTMTKVLQTHYTSDSVVEEAMHELTLEEGREDQMQWLVPGVKLLNPGAIKRASVVVVTVATFNARTGKLTAKRVYWDQASVLKQFGLIQAAGSPGVWGFHSDYVLPAVGRNADYSAFQQAASDQDHPDLVPNFLALRLEDTLSMSKGSSSNNSFSSVLSGTAPAPTTRPAVKLIQTAAEANKASHVFNDAALPQNAFNKLAINPKKFESHVPLGTTDRPTSPARSGVGASKSPTKSLYDPVTGEAPIPVVHDPQRHRTNIDFAGPKAEAETDDLTYRPARTVIATHLETTIDKQRAEDELGVPAVAKRPNPHLIAHLKDFSGESAAADDQVYLQAVAGSGQLPPHLVPSYNEEERPMRKIHHPHFESHIGEADAEVASVAKKPNPQLQTTIGRADAEVPERPTSPAKAMRKDQATTLDRPMSPTSAKPKPDLKSTVFGGDQPASSPPASPTRGMNMHKDRLKSTLKFGGEEPEPGEYKAVVVPPKEHPRHHLRSSVFDADPPRPNSPIKRPFANQGITKSEIKFGDDGGEIGKAPVVPKWIAMQEDQLGGAGLRRPPSSSKRSPGGHTTIQLG
ncbi:hypothetical protein AMAG_12654 [Allomyces macrogynus ATCC 38327]|uniref:NTF2 domain-containing protein n=1 Tax=Allomyces macrogynus (strain ATCC 38327) TaxID=578462 RepID=A0A0L0T174_ALLM3|nr:hypothetical protein AMAG_12654 [Allomyces macrogynus ATCC 38327]|eukprot:KNE68477.1 hypothetical protein AMAG_12654 [Allomyces macrogynus ATCC 38327]